MVAAHHHQISTTRGTKWLDKSLEPLFTKYLPKNLCFQPHAEEYPVPRCTDQIYIMPTTKQYAKKLLTGILTYAAAVMDKNKFSKFPMKHQDKNTKYIWWMHVSKIEKPAHNYSNYHQYHYQNQHHYHVQ